MHSVLVIAAKPTSIQGRPAWIGLLGAISSLVASCEVSETLSETTWLIPLSNGLSTLGRLQFLLAEEHVPYRVLFFEKAPEFFLSS